MMQLVATLIITIFFGLVIGYFATQNTGTISLHFVNYTVSGVPIYIAVVGALFIGIFLSWIISMVNSVLMGLTIRGKERKIKDYKKENTELLKEIHKLEIENTRMKAETNTADDDKSL